MAVNDDSLDAATSARRAAILYWVLGGLALLFGLMLIVTAKSWPELSKDPGMRLLVDEFKKNPTIDPATFFIACGVIIAGYGIVTGVIACFVWRVSPIGLIIGLSWCALTSMLLLLATMISIAAGFPGNILLPLIALIAHAWLIRWQIAALRGSPAATGTFAPPPAYVPMGAYYVPPIAPQVVK